jgi:hypothetical protein
MGLVKISDRTHEKLRLSSEALSRSINAQAEHWLRVGMLAELNPGLTYGEILPLLFKEAQGQAAGEGGGDALHSAAVNQALNLAGNEAGFLARRA